VYVGVDHVSDSGLLVGFEAQYTLLDYGDQTTCHGKCQLCAVEYTGVADVTLKLGYDNGVFNVYALGGVGRLMGSVDIANPNGSSIGGGAYETAGLAVGIGGNIHVTEHIDIGVEWTNYSFDSIDGYVGDYDYDDTASLSTIQARLTLNI
jgi:opacity protein-like surface antigen